MKQGPAGSVDVVARAYAHGSEDVVSAPLSLTGDQPAPQRLKLSSVEATLQRSNTAC